MKNKNNIFTILVVAVIVGAAAFYAGMQYQKQQAPSGNQFFTAGVNGQRSQMRGQGNGARGFGNGQNRPVAGEIINQDDKSITVKMQDGSSKIVMISDKTAINKASEAAKIDLKSGERVVVFGSTNSDGSVTAQNIQLGQMGMFRMQR